MANSPRPSRALRRAEPAGLDLAPQWRVRVDPQIERAEGVADDIAPGVMPQRGGHVVGADQHAHVTSPPQESAATRNPRLPVELSGVFEERAATLYRLQYDSWHR